MGDDAGGAPDLGALRDDPDRLAALFRAIADPSRVLILDFLRDRPRGFSEICLAIGQPKGSTSGHLALLLRLGVAARQRHGLHVVYRLTPPGHALAEFVASLPDPAE